MQDKIVMLTEWLASLGRVVCLTDRCNARRLDKMFHTNVLQGGIESDSMDQVRKKLKCYTTEIEALRGKGIGRVVTSPSCALPHTIQVPTS